MAPPPSPRRVSSNARFRSKFSVSYEALLTGEHPWINVPGSSSSSSLATPASSSYSNAGSSYFSSSNGKKPSAPRTRFYADLLCLKVEPATVEDLVQSVSARMLIDDDEGSKGARIRDNIGSLWRECLRVWSDVGHDEVSSPTFRYENGSGTDEVRRSNAVDTLLVLSRSILAKNTLTHSSTSLDLIWIFAGGIDEADDVFEGLVSAIEEGLRGELDNLSHQKRQRRPTRLPSSDFQQLTAPQTPNELPTLEELLRHRIKAVHLAIIWISEVSSTNLAAYFVRRDLFVAACSLLSTVQSIRENVNSRAAQGYASLSEEDEALLRTVVRDVTLLLGLLTGLGQAGSSAGSGGSFSAAGNSHSMYYRRLCDWVDSGSMSLLRDSVAYDFEQAWKAYEADDSPFAPASTTSSLAWGTTVSLGAVTEGVKLLGLGSASADTAEVSTSNINKLPPPCACSLLSIYLLARANQAFVQIALTPPPSTEAGSSTTQYTFASSLLSLTNYLATHGSSSDRSKSYSRLSLLTLLALLSSAAGVLAIIQEDRPGDLGLIRQCQQKSGPKPVGNIAGESGNRAITSYLSQLSLRGPSLSSQKRTRLLPYILDSCVQYLRYNLRKRLDVSGYLICLEVIKLSIYTCAERRILLEYSGWSEVWRSIQTIVVFVVGRHTELRGIQFGDLSKALLSTLSLALVESDHFLQSKEEVNILIYELVRSSQTLRRIACIAVTGKDPADESVEMSNEDAERIVSDIPGWRLVDMVLLSFEERLQEWKSKSASKSGFSFGLSVATLTGGYFKGSTNGSSSPSTADMPDVDTVMSLIASIDLERLIATVNGIESSRGAAVNKMKTNRTSVVNEEWLERAEAQCVSEAFRCASEDMRWQLAAS